MNMISAKVAIVSGGSRGLGKAIVEKLILEGWKVATFSRHENGFISQYQNKYPDQFYWYELDLKDPRELSI